MASATFTGPGGSNASTAIHQSLAALKTITVGDLLYVGEGYRARIRERTFAGVDVNGSPFAPYSNKGPFYLYVNRDATGGRSRSGTRSLTAGRANAQRSAARDTASGNRFAKTGRIGIRTPTGIKYASYAAAKAAHGAGTVNLYGMEQHPHMLDAMVVRAGGSDISQSAAGFMSGGGEMDVFMANQPCDNLQIGFYDDRADRAKGNNEGTRTSPQREFFALSAADLAWGEQAIGRRMIIRANAGAGPAGSSAGEAESLSEDRSDWVPF
jgi:hypothetical protein